MESKPELEPIVMDRLAKLHELWDKLESTTQEKARLLFDANRSELFDQSLADLKKWLAKLQQQLQGDVDEEVKDLTSANILLKKHQVCRFVILAMCCLCYNSTVRLPHLRYNYGLLWYVYFSSISGGSLKENLPFSPLDNRESSSGSCTGA